MERKVKGVLVDVERNVIEVVEITYDDVKKNYLDVYYDLLNCELFDIVTRRFGKEYLDVYIDDEGALKEYNIPAIITKDDGKIVEVIYGNVFIASHDDEGNTISLTDAQIDAVMKRRAIITGGYFGQKVIVGGL